MNEGGGVGYALKRSYELVNYKWWQTFGLFLVLGIIMVMIYFVLFNLLSPFAWGPTSSGAGGGSIMGYLLNFFLLIVFAIAGGSLIICAQVLQYFNLSEMGGRPTETEELIEELGQEKDELQERDVE